MIKKININDNEKVCITLILFARWAQFSWLKCGAKFFFSFLFCDIKVSNVVSQIKLSVLKSALVLPTHRGPQTWNTILIFLNQEVEPGTWFAIENQHKMWLFPKIYTVCDVTKDCVECALKNKSLFLYVDLLTSG